VPPLHPIPPSETFTRINRIQNSDEYSACHLNSLYHFVVEEHFLVIHWDGFLRRSDLWTAEFLENDYIGALWGNVPDHLCVGNWGFSLWSRKLLRALHGAPVKVDSSIPGASVEDVLIGKYLRPYLETQGIKFPPRELAARFTTDAPEHLEAFGFHGVEMLPVVIEWGILGEQVPEIIERTSREDFLYHWIQNALSLGKNGAARIRCEAILQNPSRHPRLAEWIRNHLRVR
jgi:hypothetical protein